MTPSELDAPVSSAAFSTGVPGTATVARFITTARDTSVLFVAVSVAEATKLMSEVFPMATQSALDNVYDHAPDEGVNDLVSPANERLTVALTSLVPVTVIPAFFSASVMLSLPPIALITTTGGVVSIRQTTATDDVEVLPAASVARAVTE